MEITPFTVAVPQAELDDLADRLARVRWPNVVDADDTAGGVPVAALRRLVEHWRDGYDWRAAEAGMNRLTHVVADVDGLPVHAVHERAPAPSGLPVVLLHGFPDSFHRFDEVVDRLTAAGHDVVVPSLPGYGFSGQPGGPLTPEVAAEAVARLMAGLGYERYAVHGGDWGSAVGEGLATAHPDRVAALHLTEVPYQHAFGVARDDASPAEKAFLDGIEEFGATMTYYSVQSATPTTLSYGLADSPVGLAAWLLDLYRRWTDREPDLDHVLTQVSLYWHTNTIRSSMRLYAEMPGSWEEDGDAGWDGAEWDGAESGGGRVEVPTALAVFPHDIGTAPREFAERFFAVERFTVMPRGGHFAAMEEPALLADDLVAFLAGRA